MNALPFLVFLALAFASVQCARYVLWRRSFPESLADVRASIRRDNLTTLQRSWFR